MSGSAALEYGFPSTHSTNAVSVAVYAVLLLRRESNTFSPTTTLILEGLSYFYAVSIVVGRLYCGMHGFFDVVIGSLLGVLIGVLEFYYAPIIEATMNSSSYLAPLTVALIVFVLVRIHPEPADDCPCFDDSVAFAGVMIGVEYGTWRLARSPLAAIYNGPDAAFSLSALGWPLATARVVFGVLCIFAWRGTMKPTLLRVLPHLFRVIETHGWSLPRRFFVPASEYKDVPLHVRDDHVLPNVSDVSKMVNSIRGPGRGRSVSIGPQSAADAYETLAYRERKRRESLESEGGVRSKQSLASLREKAAAGNGDAVAPSYAQAASSGVQSGRTISFEQAGPTGGDKEQSGEEMSEKEMFSTLVRPRVRYDVEVVTKLVIYAGIGWLAVDGMLVAFERVGLGAAV
ncbi:hypothetical protein QBC39DRAFT_18746 [Podospora conica]|nr:hypothetical protein QBC39DRAFT_18746 [Schizothecium conicum]